MKEPVSAAERGADTGHRGALFGGPEDWSGHENGFLRGRGAIVWKVTVLLHELLAYAFDDLDRSEYVVSLAARTPVFWHREHDHVIESILRIWRG